METLIEEEIVPDAIVFTEEDDVFVLPGEESDKEEN